MTTLFTQILDHEQAIAWLRAAWKAQRLPHALLFAGPVGVGKQMTARALAALVLCPDPRDDQACGRCDSCRAMAADVHPDFHLVYRQLRRLEQEKVKAKELTVEVIRQFLIAPANLKPVMNQGKVFVVDEAELMNASAQNALLKTLEEPPQRTLLILLTDQPDALLATIRSRCQLLRFGYLDGKIVEEELVRRGINPSAAADAARFTQGSLGVALRWLEDGVIERAAQLVEQLNSIMAARPPAEVQQWLKASAEAYAEKALERDRLASKDQATREGLATYLHLASNHLRSRLPSARDADEAERVCVAIDAVARAESYLDSNVNIPLVIQQFIASLERTFAEGGAAVAGPA